MARLPACRSVDSVPRPVVSSAKEDIARTVASQTAPGGGFVRDPQVLAGRRGGLTVGPVIQGPGLYAGAGFGLQGR